MRFRWDGSQVLRAIGLLRRLRPDAVLFFALGPGTFAAPLAAQAAGVRTLIRAQDTVVDGMYPRPLRLLDRMLLFRTSRTVVPSRFLKSMVVRTLHAPSDEVEVIPNGIDLDAFGRKRPDPFLRRSLGLVTGDRVVGMVANLVQVKNHTVLLRAVPRVLGEIPRARFLLVGEGPLRPELEKQARDLGIQANVRFLGYRNDVHAIIPLFDAAVLASRVETHSIFIIEAMASGIPVVAPAVGGIPEVVDHRSTGLLVSAGDPDALARDLVMVLKNPRLAARLGRNARKSAHRRFSSGAMVRAFESLFEREAER
jgi:glycosyltransferase involved in cell wall biosynthesis